MILVFCLAMMMDSGAMPDVIGDTELYKPLRSGDVAVSDNGHVFIVDFDEARLLHYNEAGKRLEDIGRKGKGPGEFQNPTRVWYEDGHLFVHDAGMSAVSKFKADGSFVERATFQSVPRMTKTPGGWLMLNVFQADEDGNITLYQTDNMLKNKTAIVTFPKKVSGGELRVEMDGSSVPKVPYNPVSDDYHLIGGPQTPFAFLSYPGNLKVDVIDTRTKKVVRTITRELNKLPFNKDWGDSRLKTASERNSRMGAQFKFVPDFPETFPLVSSVNLTGSGDLVLNLWTGMPDDVEKAMVLNSDGGDVQLPYKAINDDRVMAVRGNSAFVSTFNEEDGAGMIQCALTEVDRVIEAHPINFEGSTARLIMRMN